MTNETDRKIDVTAKQSLLVQNRQQTHDWTLIGSGATGLDILVWIGYAMNSLWHSGMGGWSSQHCTTKEERKDGILFTCSHLGYYTLILQSG